MDTGSGAGTTKKHGSRLITTPDSTRNRDEGIKIGYTVSMNLIIILKKDKNAI